MKALTKEDFGEWLASPITEEVMDRANTVVQDCRLRWVQLLEEDPTPELLASLPGTFVMLQGRMMAHSDFAETLWEDVAPEGEQET